MKETTENYPLHLTASDETATRLLTGRMNDLLKDPMFAPFQRYEVLESFSAYLDAAKTHFTLEEEARKNGTEGANLFYHGKEHAVYQVTYDAIEAVDIVLKRRDALSDHLTPNGVFATIASAPFHDIGYVYGVPVGENFAARTPVHVTESMQRFGETVDQLGAPSGFDRERIKIFGGLAIHKTNFPYTDEHENHARNILDKLPSEDRKEAQIVRNILQFADLGGQCARVDYFPEGVKRLRDEMNAARPNNGTLIVGNDNELEAKANGFITFVVDKTVGKTGRAILGKGISPYANRWATIGKR